MLTLTFLYLSLPYSYQESGVENHRMRLFYPIIKCDAAAMLDDDHYSNIALVNVAIG